MDPTPQGFYIFPNLTTPDLGTLQSLFFLDTENHLDPSFSNWEDTVT